VYNNEKIGISSSQASNFKRPALHTDWIYFNLHFWFWNVRNLWQASVSIFSVHVEQVLELNAALYGFMWSNIKEDKPETFFGKPGKNVLAHVPCYCMSFFHFLSVFCHPLIKVDLLTMFYAKVAKPGRPHGPGPSLLNFEFCLNEFK